MQYNILVEEINVLKRLRQDILTAAYLSKEGHIPSAYSILELIYSFYKHLDQTKSKNNLDREFDQFVLSKGHGALALYAVLAEFGYFSKNWVNNFAKFNSRFGGHPDRLKIPGVEASTGSLGHGIGIALGIAYAQKLKNSETNVYCLIGDGELNEGTIWESLLVASQHQLDNFIVMVDQNNSSSRSINTKPLKTKFESFGFNCIEINGHNLSETDSIYKKDRLATKPRAVIANTLKGFGIKTMENNFAWHHKTPSVDEYMLFMKELS